MKRALVSLCLLFVPLVVSAQAQAQAQAPPQPQMFVVHEEVARPSMLAQYESSTRDLVSALTEKKADPTLYGWSAFMTPDFHYLYVLPIANWSGMDTLMQGWMNMGQTVGKERWAELSRRNGAAMASYSEFVVMRRPDLSYVPATPRLKPSEVNFVHWSFYYLDPAHPQEEVDQVARDYAALFRSKNVPDPFTVYQGINGTDLPYFVVSTPAKSAADYYAENERVESLLGADERPLAARALAATRRFNVREGTLRLDLMTQPPPAAK